MMATADHTSAVRAEMQGLRRLSHCGPARPFYGLFKGACAAGVSARSTLPLLNVSGQTDQTMYCHIGTLFSCKEGSRDVAGHRPFGVSPEVVPDKLVDRSS